VGSFLLVCGSEANPELEAKFSLGLALAERLGLGEPRGTLHSGQARVGAFSRGNGSGGRLVSDPATGDWLLAVGTWFHQDDFGTGSEEQLLGRYLAVGPRALARELEGFFVIAAGEAAGRAVVAMTDITGSCHGFWRAGADWVAVSSSSLLLAGLGEAELDPVACQEFLATGVIYEDRTLFRQVRKLGPARVIRFEQGRLGSEERYWQIADLDPDALGERRAREALFDSLTRAARRVATSFARPVCDLTGGYDSRAMLAAFLRAGAAFSTTVSGPPQSADVVISRRLAENLGIPHLHLESPSCPSFGEMESAVSLTDGECDLAEYARVMGIHRRLSERFDISINGSYGELARGYWWELLFPSTGSRRPLDSTRVARARYAAGSYDLSLFLPEVRLNLVDHFRGVIERANAGLTHLPNTLQLDHVYLALRMQRWQGRIASSTNRLWPCLSPFMFRSVLETVLQTRAGLRQRSYIVRSLLIEYQPRLADFPLEHGYPALPASFRNFYRFWPLLAYYSRRVVAKLAPPKGSIASDGPSLPERLWREPEVIDILRPEKMGLSGLASPSRLADFLERSQRSPFPFAGQWTRLLSLELALRAVGGARDAAARAVSAGAKRGSP